MTIGFKCDRNWPIGVNTSLYGVYYNDLLFNWLLQSAGCKCGISPIVFVFIYVVHRNFLHIYIIQESLVLCGYRSDDLLPSCGESLDVL